MSEAAIAAAISRLMPKEARWRYFQKANGPMFVWTVEPYNLVNPDQLAQGRYESVVYLPRGKGSRSGKATRWEMAEGSRSLHDLRKDAKARALRLYQAWQETGKVEV